MATEKPKLTAKQINEAAEQSLKEKAAEHKIIVTKRAIIGNPDDPAPLASPAPSDKKELKPPSAVALVPTRNIKPAAPSEEEGVSQPVTESIPEENTTPEPEETAEKTETLDEAETPGSDVKALIESGQYYLPINSVEKKRAKRVAVAGTISILLLGAAWFTLALDAGLIEVDGIEPVTDFFS